MIIGSKDSVAFEIGGVVQGQAGLRLVDIWLSGLRVTYADNIAYLPSFVCRLEHDLASFSRPKQRQHEKVNMASHARRFLCKRVTKKTMQYRIFNLDETTDDLYAYAFTHGQKTFISFTLRPSSRLHVLSIGTQELTTIIAGTIRVCKCA